MICHSLGFAGRGSPCPSVPASWAALAFLAQGIWFLPPRLDRDHAEPSQRHKNKPEKKGRCGTCGEPAPCWRVCSPMPTQPPGLPGDASPPADLCRQRSGEMKGKPPVGNQSQRGTASVATSTPKVGGEWGVRGMRIIPYCPSRGHLWALLVVPPITASTGMLSAQGGTGGHTFVDSIPVCVQGPCGEPGEPGQKGQRGYTVSGGAGGDAWLPGGEGLGYGESSVWRA